MPAKPKRKKPLNLLIKLEPQFAVGLIETATSEGRSASQQAKKDLETKYAKP